MRDSVGIVIALVVFSAWMLAWVRWNRNIYKRRHRRRHPLVQEVSFTHDTRGRRIVAPPGTLTRRGETVVWIDPSDEVKHYESGASDELERDPLAAFARDARRRELAGQRHTRAA